jgi:hypothetical protein
VQVVKNIYATCIKTLFQWLQSNQLFIKTQKSKNMEKIVKARPIKFFTKEEVAILKPYITGGQKFTLPVCNTIAEELSRTPSSVYQYVYRKRSLSKANKAVAEVKKSTVDTTATRDKSVNNNTPVFKHGEFIIPVSSWEVRTNNGTTSLVLKFDKSI